MTLVPDVPDVLLAPLLQAAGDHLREMKAQDVPPAIRPLLGFDRRGFASASARAQLHRALETEEEFRDEVLEVFTQREEVQVLVEGWSRETAVEQAIEAGRRDDLPLLVSGLIAARPHGWEFGLGAAVAVHRGVLSERAEDDDRRAFDTQLEKAVEAARRAEDEAEALRTEVARIDEELKQERASRRDREEAVRAEAEAAQARLDDVQRESDAARTEIERAQERAANEARRASELEEELRETRSELTAIRADQARARARREQEQREREGTPSPLHDLGPEDLELLTRAGELARRLREETDADREGERGAEPSPSRSTPARRPPPVSDVPTTEQGERARSRTSRVRVEVPKGMTADSVEGLEAALKGTHPLVLVDGYNVSKLAWGEDPPDAQRQRLCALLERLHLRTNSSVTVVFDGADVEGVRPPRRPGVRVRFSAPDEEADDVVIREVAAQPLERPVVVVSSDRRVQRDSEDEGALVVPSDVFLEVLRR